MQQEKAGHRQVSGTLRWAYLALGFLMLVLGFIGVFLPVLPTTIFIILAAWFFGRSSPRLEAWLLGHPGFGPTLRNWRDKGAISPRAKMAASAGMMAGYALFWWSARPGWPLATGVAVLMLGCAAFVLSRPD
ncbi:DUF454 domain-containing protein [Phyllobacterium salinisoli]|uniref:DUF454 domain-containing protein n=1 Tax=Phyllobacterium salinisoli TaxID=1899321 RepID=A0A368K9S1_9HYPH|nr:YbaN family protein [Phyllobacterium salinisoli]RCS25243.1 DUF454 domain-containing protein [Phyllobacterium salinisoli]